MKVQPVSFAPKQKEPSWHCVCNCVNILQTKRYNIVGMSVLYNQRRKKKLAQTTRKKLDTLGWEKTFPGTRLKIERIFSTLVRETVTRFVFLYIYIWSVLLPTTIRNNIAAVESEKRINKSQSTTPSSVWWRLDIGRLINYGIHFQRESQFCGLAWAPNLIMPASHPHSAECYI